MARQIDGGSTVEPITAVTCSIVADGFFDLSVMLLNSLPVRCRTFCLTSQEYQTIHLVAGQSAELWCCSSLGWPRRWHPGQWGKGVVMDRQDEARL